MLILKPSKIQGVGVFTTKSIKEEIYLPLFARRDYLNRCRVSAIETHYCIKDGDSWHGPKDFYQMSIGWYLNHSKNPNIYHLNYKYFTKRKIRAGEELTIDYKTL